MGFRPWLETLEDRLAPATLTVTNTSDTGGSGSLRGEIAAAPGDTIVFASNVTGNIQLTTASGGQFTINKNLTIQGPGANVLRVTAAPNSRVFYDGTSSTSLTISGLTITGGNATASAGGGIAVIAASDLTLTNCTVAGNTAGAAGGVYFNVGPSNVLTILNSTISGNTATVGRGGGIYTSGGMLTVQNSTISSNTASSDGGGIRTIQTMATVQNSTISGNTAGGVGGGISTNTFAPSPPPVTLQSTIVSGNTAVIGNDIYRGGLGVTINADHSLIQSIPPGTINGTNTANIFGQDPLLGPLQDNGGPTFTETPGSGSPALDTGSNPVGLTTDQRGFNRSVNGSVDIGAVESQPAATITLTSSLNPATVG